MLAYTMTASTINCIGTQYSSLTSTLGAATSNIGGAVYINGATTTTQFTTNTIKYCYSGDKGGAYSIISSSIVDTSSTYSYNGAVYGGAVYCDTCTISLTKVAFQNNEAYDGGTFYLKDIQSFTQSSISVTTSYAFYNGGIFYITGTATNTLDLETLTFTTASAGNNGGSFYIDNPN